MATMKHFPENQIIHSVQIIGAVLICCEYSQSDINDHVELEKGTVVMAARRAFR